MGFDEIRPACVLRPMRQKAIDGHVAQSDYFENVPRHYESFVFISKNKACFLGRKPSTAKVGNDFKACLPESWQSVSALHAVFKWQDGKLSITDRSSNGTWVGLPGKGAGDSETDFRRLEKGKEETVDMHTYIMLAQWPAGRRADDVLMCGFLPLWLGESLGYQVEVVPQEASKVQEVSSGVVAGEVAVPVGEVAASGNVSAVPKAVVTPVPKLAPSMEPCKMCKAQTEEALLAKEQLAAEKNKLDKAKKEKEKVDKELGVLKKELDASKKAATDAKKAAQAEKKKLEQAAQAKKAEVDKELVKAKKQLKEVTAARDRMREGMAPLLSTIKKLREQIDQNRADVAQMDTSFCADVQSLDEVMKTHTLNQGNEALQKEHEREIAAMQKDRRRVEREAAAWRLKAEAYATKLPDELNSVLNSHLPNLVQECIDKRADGEEERAIGPEHSQKTVVSTHLLANGTPDQPTPMTCDVDAVPPTAGPDSLLNMHTSPGGVASVSLKDMAHGCQEVSPGAGTVAGPIAGLKRQDGVTPVAEQGDGKRRRVGSARASQGAAADSPENHSQVNVSTDGKSQGNKKTAAAEKSDRSQPQQDEAAVAPNGKEGNDARGATWTAEDSLGAPSDLMKKLAALPKSHSGMDF